ncbi:MAG: glycosyl transferase family 1, partial [Muribaculaceae bacterium]|nr:glycosyl transferase family 1 [Muribaculaceae bacterium]
TPWKELEDHDCGWWRDNSTESVARVIDEIVEKSPAELLAMGIRGRELVLEKYEASKVAAKMLQLYSWLLGNGEKPDFVHLS